MRLWLDPNKVASRGLTAGDVVRAVREQNVQVSAGQLGAEPTPNNSDFLVSINAQGRLQTEEEFGRIVIKSGVEGEIVRLSDVARIELGAGNYTLRSQLDNKDAVAIPIFQSPGANAIALSDAVRAKMAELSTRFPEGMSYEVVYDPTVFVRDSIKAVVMTLLEATLLVVLVVILFLQTWRASIIPLLAVPVSIVGTFAALQLLGFSINTLTLFGLVLAIGIVVDDAIVVVENVERNIGEGMTPLAAAHQAMREVSGPIIAIALVLCAVFVPMAFLSGVTGQFYKQFAATIAISTVISAINSLTLSPALAAALLKPHDATKDAPSRLIERLFGWIFRPFNRFFAQQLASLPGRRVARARQARRGVRGVRGAAGRHRRDVRRGAGRFHPDPGQAVPDRRREAAGRRLAGPHRRDDPQDERDRAGSRRRAERGRLPGPERAAVHQHAQYRHGVLPAEAAGRARAERGRDHRRAQPEVRRHEGGLRVRDHAAADPRPRPGLGLLAVRAGSRGPRLRRAAERGERILRRDLADAGHAASRSAPTRPTCPSSTRRSTAKRPRPRACR